MKRFFILLLCFSIFLIPLSAGAVFYNAEFPTSIGQSGGVFVKGTSGRNTIIVNIPADKKDYFTVDTTGEPVYIGSSTCNCEVYINNELFTGRYNSFGYLEYRTVTGMASSWVSFSNFVLTDTNLKFITDDSNFYNDDLQLSEYQIIIIALLCCLLFFEVLNWFLFHKVG